MVDREEVESEVRENGVEVIETGNWYIAEGTYGERTTVVQSDLGRERAIAKLIDKFYERERKQERRERERELIEEEMEMERELSEKREQRAMEEVEREVEAVRKRFED